MSYIQIEIGGKQRGVKFNQYAVILMAKFMDYEQYEASSAYAMIYGGLMACAYVKKQELINDADVELDGTQIKAGEKVSFEQVCSWVDQLDKETIDKVANVFMETQEYKNLIGKGEKDNELTKKK